MAVTQIGAPEVQSAAGSWSGVVDYDSTARVIAITPSGNGHARLTLIDTATQTPLGIVNLDQFGTTSGTVRMTESDPVNHSGDAGTSDGPVAYRGQRVIVAGPGAVGVQRDGSPLPTNPVQGNVVSRFNPPKGTAPSLSIGLDWTAN